MTGSSGGMTNGSGEGGGGGDSPPRGGAEASPSVGTDGFNSLASMMGAVGFGGAGGTVETTPAEGQSENIEPGAQNENDNAGAYEGDDSNSTNNGSFDNNNDSSDTQDNPNIGSDGTFLGGSYEGMKNAGKQGPEVPPSLMRDYDSNGGDWSPHSGNDRKSDMEKDPRERANERLDRYLDKSQAQGKGEVDDGTRNDTQRRELEKVTQSMTHENLQKGNMITDKQQGHEIITDGDEGKDKQNNKFLGSKWQELLKRKGGSAVSSAQYLPRGGGSRLSDGKQPMGAFDKAVMGMNEFKTRAEAVSDWNGIALRNYRGQLLKSPGVAGDIAREEYRREHPGAVG